jgi:hypothetical protein
MDNEKGSDHAKMRPLCTELADPGGCAVLVVAICHRRLVAVRLGHLIPLGALTFLAFCCIRRGLCGGPIPRSTECESLSVITCNNSPLEVLYIYTEWAQEVRLKKTCEVCRTVTGVVLVVSQLPKCIPSVDGSTFGRIYTDWHWLVFQFGTRFGSPLEGGTVVQQSAACGAGMILSFFPNSPGSSAAVPHFPCMTSPTFLPPPRSSATLTTVSRFQYSYPSLLSALSTPTSLVDSDFG